MGIIKIRGARTHNLKNLNIDLKKDKITCITGPSGSGKTSLAFHTLLVESKRRYINSFPNDVKFFWDIPQSVDVDEISPVLPVWGLPQVNPVVGSRLVVADHLDIHHQLEKLFFHCGQAVCPHHDTPLVKIQPLSSLVSALRNEFQHNSGCVAHLLLPRETYQGFFGAEVYPVRTYLEEQKQLVAFTGDQVGEYWEFHRVTEKSLGKLAEGVREEFSKIPWRQVSFYIEERKQRFTPESEEKWCCTSTGCDYGVERYPESSFELSPYNPISACQVCSGHGMQLLYDPSLIVKNEELSLRDGAVALLNYSRFSHLRPAMIKAFERLGLSTTCAFSELPDEKWDLLFDGDGPFPGVQSLIEYLETKKYKKNVRIYLRSLQSEVWCEACMGTRLAQEAFSWRIRRSNKSIDYLDAILGTLDGLREGLLGINFEKSSLASKLAKSLIEVLSICSRLGLGHLSLSKKVRQLNVSEYQRLLLAKILSFQGTGSLLILDEATTGLSISQQEALLSELKKLVAQGNTILLVDHSEWLQARVDELIVMGPEAGSRGGEVVYQGPPKTIKTYIDEVVRLAGPSEQWDFFIGTNSKNYRFQGGAINLVTTSFDQLFDGDSEVFFMSQLKSISKDTVERIQGVKVFNANIGRGSSRSTVGTVTGLSQYMRKQFCQLEIAKKLDLQEGHFSTYSSLGQCPSCEGKGLKTVDMQFMEDLVFVCDDCRGMKLRPFYAKISNGNYTFHEVMTLPIDKTLQTVRLTAKYSRLLGLLKKLNLGYLELDRGLSTLSGGERIRIKLLKELERPSVSNLYVFENLSLGLSGGDLVRVVNLLNELILEGNTIILFDQSPYFQRAAHNTLNL